MNDYDQRFLRIAHEVTGGLGRAPVPTGNYIPASIAPGIVYSAGQVAVCGDRILYPGKIGLDVTIEQAYLAAKVACLNCLFGIYEALGTLNKITGVLKLNGYVCCTDHFSKLPDVMNGASDVLTEIFGEKGRHPRATIGVAGLAFGASVEVEIICKTDI